MSTQWVGLTHFPFGVTATEKNAKLQRPPLVGYCVCVCVSIAFDIGVCMKSSFPAERVGHT